MCQEHQEGNRRPSVCILATKSKEMMKEFNILGTIVVATIILVNFWVLGGFSVNT
jgi:hypothetical protein